jgi:hypothetical protein
MALSRLTTAWQGDPLTMTGQYRVLSAADRDPRMGISEAYSEDASYARQRENSSGAHSPEERHKAVPHLISIP